MRTRVRATDDAFSVRRAVRRRTPTPLFLLVAVVPALCVASAEAPAWDGVPGEAGGAGRVVQEGTLQVTGTSAPARAGVAAIYGTPGRFSHRKGEELVRSTGKRCTECHIGAWYPGGDFFWWEHKAKWDIHWVSFSVAALVMTTGLYGAVSFWRKGRSHSLQHPLHWPSIGRALFWEVILGRRVWRQSRLRWAIFFLISMNFIALFAVFLAIVVTRFICPMTFFTNGPGAWALDFFSDLFGLMVLIGAALALYRRTVRKEPHLESEAEDLFLLWMLVAIVVSGFFLEACRLAVVGHSWRAYASFVGFVGARILASFDISWTGLRAYVWVVHAILVFVFIAYLPFSKLFHVIACPASILASASEAAYRQRQ